MLPIKSKEINSPIKLLGKIRAIPEIENTILSIFPTLKLKNWALEPEIIAINPNNTITT